MIPKKNANLSIPNFQVSILKPIDIGKWFIRIDRDKDPLTFLMLRQCPKPKDSLSQSPDCQLRGQPKGSVHRDQNPQILMMIVAGHRHPVDHIPGNITLAGKMIV